MKSLNETSNNVAQIIATFDDGTDEAVNIIKKYWQVLKMDNDLVDILHKKSTNDLLKRKIHKG